MFLKPQGYLGSKATCELRRYSVRSVAGSGQKSSRNPAEMRLSKAKVEAEGAEMSPVTDTNPGIWPVKRCQTMRGRAVRAPAVRNCRCRARVQIAHPSTGGPAKFSRNSCAKLRAPRLLGLPATAHRPWECCGPVAGGVCHRAVTSARNGERQPRARARAARRARNDPADACACSRLPVRDRARVRRSASQHEWLSTILVRLRKNSTLRAFQWSIFTGSLPGMEVLKLLPPIFKIRGYM